MFYVTVFDQAQSKVVLSAIRDAGLELTPASSGNVILVPVPKYRLALIPRESLSLLFVIQAHERI